MLDSAPFGSLLLIIGGSPCRDLTCCGPFAGLAGVCGTDSYFFYAVPAVTWAAQQARPDLEVHTLVENAGSTRAEHRRTMEAALGLQGMRRNRKCLNADR